MFSVADRQLYYSALLARDTGYDGVFYVGVRTTGVFCRPVCPARKPKFENCVFFRAAGAALAALFRPCLRCRPLGEPDEPGAVGTLLSALEADPERRWRERDVQALGIDASTARRGFKRRFGLTFAQYARAQRLGRAQAQLQAGESVITAQLAAGYASGSGFRAAFTRTLGAAPSRHAGPVLKAAQLGTPLGPLLAVADEAALYLLGFADRRGLEGKLERLRQTTKAAVIPGETSLTGALRRELAAYFGGERKTFTTPLVPLGSPFQQCVWEALRRVPYGKTRTYTELAAAVGRPEAVRAVAGAVGANPFALAVPCHRVVGADGALRGYGGGLNRKSWLLAHEREHLR